MAMLALIFSTLASAVAVTTGLVKAARALWALAMHARRIVERLDDVVERLDSLSKTLEHR